MNMPNVKPAYLIGGVVITIGLAIFGGFALKDHFAKKVIQQTQQQIVAKDKEIAATKKMIGDAELRAAQAEGSRLTAEARYKAALDRLHQLEQHPQVVTNVNAPTVAPLPEPANISECKVQLEAEHEARVACGEALVFAQTEISALKDANLGLHAEAAKNEERNELKDKALELVSEDRDTQLHRKKLWRTTALAAIGGALLLLL